MESRFVSSFLGAEGDSSPHPAWFVPLIWVSELSILWIILLDIYYHSHLTMSANDCVPLPGRSDWAKELPSLLMRSWQIFKRIWEKCFLGVYNFFECSEQVTYRAYLGKANANMAGMCLHLFTRPSGYPKWWHSIKLAVVSFVIIKACSLKCQVRATTMFTDDIVQMSLVLTIQL